MKPISVVVPAAVLMTGLASGPSAASVDRAGETVIPGTVVSATHDEIVLKTDDHGHRMVFQVATGASVPDVLRRGAHVSVTYHPLGPTGQAIDEVQVIELGASARSQASFKVVWGPAGEPRLVAAR